MGLISLPTCQACFNGESWLSKKRGSVDFRCRLIGWGDFPPFGENWGAVVPLAPPGEMHFLHRKIINKTDHSSPGDPPQAGSHSPKMAQAFSSPCEARKREQNSPWFQFP